MSQFCRMLVMGGMAIMLAGSLILMPVAAPSAEASGIGSAVRWVGTKVNQACNRNIATDATCGELIIRGGEAGWDYASSRWPRGPQVHSAPSNQLGLPASLNNVAIPGLGR